MCSFLLGRGWADWRGAFLVLNDRTNNAMYFISLLMITSLICIKSLSKTKFPSLSMQICVQPLTLFCFDFGLLYFTHGCINMIKMVCPIHS